MWTPGTSCLVSLIPGCAFFQQTVFQGEVGHDLLQRLVLVPQVLDLARGRGASRVVAGQTPLARLVPTPDDGRGEADVLRILDGEGCRRFTPFVESRHA